VQFVLQPADAASRRRSILDVLAASGPLSSSHQGPAQLVTWIVMDYCERGPLSGLAVRMADDSLEVKLVGGLT
jgi:hypothetical protein